MPKYKIRGINVDFPFEAYDCQLVYMEKVIESLQNKCNALLESPTGTGKTLCLLCATLAWRKSLGKFTTGRSQRLSTNSSSKSDDAPSQASQPESRKFPVIVYTSRTHSQIRQVIQELKRSSYRPKMVVIGSREQLCIHDDVKLLHGKAQTNACRVRRKRSTRQSCSHFVHVTEFVTKNPHLGEEPIDIEDLVHIGRTCGPCPYYLSRDLHKNVDILFSPYNYLIDRGNRKSLAIDWSNSILIFDEAHNLESLCADAASFDLSYGLLSACVSEVQKCIHRPARMELSNDKSTNQNIFSLLEGLLLKFKKRIADVPIEIKELGFTKPGPYIYELLSEFNITHETVTKHIDMIEEVVELLEEATQLHGKGTICRLESIVDFLNLIFRDKGNTHANSYRVHVHEGQGNATDAFKGKASRTLSWWCFNPGIAMEEFSKMGVGSIILTSGTLSPLDSFAQELKLDFPVRLENPHVISSSQIWAGIIPYGPSGRSFNSSYRNRDSAEYKQELGNAIVNFARIVPDGLLVFFPSYYLMDQAIECWKRSVNENPTTIWERICKHKLPVIEPRQSSLFTLSIEDYMTKLKGTSGAIFFAVCRGKVSEGLDFADHAGRAVVITGMPFATLTDPKVRLKRQYLDEQALLILERSKIITGEEWYSQQESRAVNQAVGRVIRHQNDYGAIIFCDERFTRPNRQSQVSCWIQPHLKCYSTFGDVVFTLTQFFRSNGACGLPKPKIEPEENGMSSNYTLNSFMQVSPDSTSVSAMPSIEENSEAIRNFLPMDKSHLKEFLTPMNLTRQSCSMKSLSSKLEVKTSITSQLRDVVPANRSFLSHFKENQANKLKNVGDLISYERKLQIPEKKSIKDATCEIVDLTDDLPLSKKPVKEEFLSPCSSKKQKVWNTKDAETSNERDKRSRSGVGSFMINRVKQEDLSVSNSQSLSSAQCFSTRSCKDDEGPSKNDIGSLNQKNKGVQLASVPCAYKETNGASFLIHVQEKLSSEEYNKFIRLLKALKRELTIEHTLQSIVRLFSRPERLPLLRRFRDYVPSKYHSLYEQYFEKMNNQLSKS